LILDNSAANAFRFCPLRYYERYVRNIEPAYESEGLAFGTRMHALLEEHFGGRPAGPPNISETLEAEAQAMIAAYAAFWGHEDFEIVRLEQTFTVEIPGTHHSIAGKFDGIIRFPTGTLAIFEHKTEKSGGKHNLPEAWAQRAQVSLYQWAAQQLYQEPICAILLDVLTRGTPKGLKGPHFRRDLLIRTDEQIQKALRDFVYVADQIEKLKASEDWRDWPANTDNCHSGWFQCPYNALHLYGRDEGQLVNFREATPYLDL
jgi:hypothetical protein